uniref:Methyltransferase 22, Kin17 lysine n=1 Tax=Amphilophus citrinellus TaxID=61819 RepID=A0A3Q0RJJ1_AMPCI
MEQITFHHDTVLSDVHMLHPSGHHFMTHLNSVGQPGVYDDVYVTITQKAMAGPTNAQQLFVRKRSSSAAGGVSHPVCVYVHLINESHLFTEHTMATPLEDVGKQVWRGALLLADFILSDPDMFRGATVLELGAGTGLTSIIMTTVAKTVYCTDVGEDLLSMCKRNIALNKHILEPAGGEVKVRQLDWLQDDFCTDPTMEFSWTNEEVADLNNTSFIIAADVCYDDDLTDGLFRTLCRLCSNFPRICTIFISMEKRMNFTLRHMDVSCEAYDHFIHCMCQLQEMVDGRCRFRVEQLPSNFGQFLLYERVEQLVSETFAISNTIFFSVFFFQLFNF